MTSERTSPLQNLFGWLVIFAIAYYYFGSQPFTAAAAFVESYAPIFQMIVVSLFILMLCLLLLRKLIWLMSPFFFLLDRIQWWLFNPLRHYFRDLETNRARITYLVLLFTGIVPIWWIVVYLISAPLRLINAIYFDFLLYGCNALTDAAQELFFPMRRGFKRMPRVNYVLRWIYSLPLRMLIFLWHSFWIIVDIHLMFAISIIFPTYTAFHGTHFQSAAVDIAQKGRWYIGSGTFAGAGIYFGLSCHIAEHYAPSNHDRALLVTRISPTLTYNSATLPAGARQLIGNDGRLLSRYIASRFWAGAIEHWRVDKGWWEYCFPSADGASSYNLSWRLRPVAIIRGKKLARVWGGYSRYCAKWPSAWFIGIISWGIIHQILPTKLWPFWLVW